MPSTHHLFLKTVRGNREVLQIMASAVMMDGEKGNDKDWSGLTSFVTDNIVEVSAREIAFNETDIEGDIWETLNFKPNRQVTCRVTHIPGKRALQSKNCRAQNRE